jgi:hypothetical protein
VLLIGGLSDDVVASELAVVDKSLISSLTLSLFESLPILERPLCLIGNNKSLQILLLLLLVLLLNVAEFKMNSGSWSSFLIKTKKNEIYFKLFSKLINITCLKLSPKKLDALFEKGRSLLYILSFLQIFE